MIHYSHNSQFKTYLFLWLPVIFWAALLFACSNQPDPYSFIPRKLLLLLQPTYFLGKRLTWYVGIFSHFIEFGILAFFLARALLKPEGITQKRIFFAFFFTLFYAFTDEVHQLFVPGRAFEVVDLLLDSFGAILGLGIYTLLLRRQKHKLAKFAQNLHTDPA